MSAIYQIDVQITAPVTDTEVTDRVADAITNLFPTADPEFQHGELVAETHDMDHFSELLHRFEILDSTRSVFFDNRENDTIAFDLKKQAAFEERINFAVGDPSELGDIHVRVRVNEPSVEEFVDYVAPETQEGKPVDLDG